jgi:hypothetical protein
VAHEKLERARGLLLIEGAERLAALEGELEGRALQVLDEDLGVVGIDPGLLDRRAEEVLRLAREELIERSARGDQDADAPPIAPSRAAEPLPRRRDAPGIARADDRIERR